MSILRLFLLPPTVPQKCVNAGLRIFLALQSSIWFSSLKTFIICHNSKTQPNLKCGIVPPKLYLYIDNDNNNKQQIKCHPLGMFTDGGKGVSSQTPPGGTFFFMIWVNRRLKLSCFWYFVPLRLLFTATAAQFSCSNHDHFVWSPCVWCVERSGELC